MLQKQQNYEHAKFARERKRRDREV